MDKATLKAFMTKIVNINNIDIQKIIEESDGNAFLNIDTDGKTDTHLGPFYVLFTPKTFIFCTNADNLKTTFEKCCKQFPDANLRMVCLPGIKQINCGAQLGSKAETNKYSTKLCIRTSLGYICISLCVQLF